MCSACVERDDYAFMFQIDFYIIHSRNVLQHGSQIANAFIAIFPFNGDFYCF
jgi:hypothetical protein